MCEQAGEAGGNSAGITLISILRAMGLQNTQKITFQPTIIGEGVTTLWCRPMFMQKIMASTDESLRTGWHGDYSSAEV